MEIMVLSPIRLPTHCIDVKVPMVGMGNVGRPSSAEQNAVRADVFAAAQHIIKSPCSALLNISWSATVVDSDGAG